MKAAGCDVPTASVSHVLVQHPEEGPLTVVLMPEPHVKGDAATLRALHRIHTTDTIEQLNEILMPPPLENQVWIKSYLF